MVRKVRNIYIYIRLKEHFSNLLSVPNSQNNSEEVNDFRIGEGDEEKIL